MIAHLKNEIKIVFRTVSFADTDMVSITSLKNKSSTHHKTLLVF